MSFCLTPYILALGTSCFNSYSHVILNLGLQDLLSCCYDNKPPSSYLISATLESKMLRGEAEVYSQDVFSYTSFDTIMLCGMRLLLLSLFGSYLWTAVYVWMPSWICSVSTELNQNRISFLICCLSKIGYKRNLHNIWKVKIKQLPFLFLGVRVRLGTIAVHACHHQSTGSHCCYTVAGP